MISALILAPYGLTSLEKLRQSIEVTYESWFETRRIYDPDKLTLRLNNEQIDILVIESDFVFEDIFEQATSLRFVGICRSATNHVDIEAATRHGVAVVNTPSRNAQAVAEHSLGLMLSLARKIPAAHHFVAEGRWQNPVEPYLNMRGVELAGRTLGVIGMGAIGRRLAAICFALDMTVIAYDPYVDVAPPNVTLKGLDELLVQSDFVSVHVPLTEETEAMLDSRRLALMKPSAFLINATDASVVDQDALVGALRNKRIGGAALDVFETHPVAPHNPLLTLDNVVLTPHLGGATEETIERHSQMMTNDILRFLQGERPDNMVNPEVWDRRG